MHSYLFCGPTLKLDKQPVMLDSWVKFITSKYKSEEESTPTETYADIKKTVEMKWDQAYIKASTAVIAFIKKGGEKVLLNINEVMDDNDLNTLTQQTPRSWDMAVHALAGAEIFDLTETEWTFMLGCIIGHEVAHEFCTFRRHLDLPDPQLLLENKIAWAPNRDRVDIIYAVLTSCVQYVQSCLNKKDKDQEYKELIVFNCQKVRGAAMQVSIEYATVVTHSMIQWGYNTKEYAQKIISKLSELRSYVKK